VNAPDSEAALTIAQQSAPRLIFLSIDRSGSGRTRFLQALRANDHTRHIPVAMLSNGHDRSMEHVGLRQVGRELW
jgi:PleD family two-component response regulator